MEKKKTILPLPFGTSELYFYQDGLTQVKTELEEFIYGMDYMNSLKFLKNVLFTHELQANNCIEGYNDDVQSIASAIQNRSGIKDDERKKRILNLYKGYRYILSEENIFSEEKLKELYQILSEGLLTEYEQDNMGEYYRNDEVLVDISENFSENEFDFIVNLKRNPKYNSEVYYNQKYKDVAVGVEPSEISHYMNALFNFAQNDDYFSSSSTDIFIKSQIIHFYFVYVHPFFDINGRTARTSSMWYLINNKEYPFIIFNRAITLAKKEYYNVIREAREFHNITFFLKYMMKKTIIELEKEHLMEVIGLNIEESLSSLDFQNLHYILSMKGNLTYADFCTFYNYKNEKKSDIVIYKTMLEPLLEKGAIVQMQKTNHGFSPSGSNYFFRLNYELFDREDSKIKHLKI